MRSHKAIEVDKLLREHLPYGYSKKIVERAKDKNIETTSQVVRNVKSFITKDIEIFMLLVEFASEQKEKSLKAQESIQSIISDN